MALAAVTVAGAHDEQGSSSTHTRYLGGHLLMLRPGLRILSSRFFPPLSISQHRYTTPLKFKSISRTTNTTRMYSTETQEQPLDFNAGPLVWVDCEMTGLNPKKDKIIEIAVRVLSHYLIIRVVSASVKCNCWESRFSLRMETLNLSMRGSSL